MKKQFIRMIALLAILLFCTNPVFALTVNTEKEAEHNSNAVISGVTTLELVEKKLCEIAIKKPSTNETIGQFTKELTAFDAKQKEAILTLTVENLMKEAEMTKKPLEVFLVLDSSNSMTSSYKGKSKIQYVVEAANKFTTTIFDRFENCKVGIVSFSSTSSNYGTIKDATLLSPLSNDEAAVLSSITTYQNSIGSFTNVEAGLTLAESSFSANKEAEKYIILLSDGVPNLCLDTQTTLQYSGVVSQRTKAKLQNLYANGYYMYSILLGLNESTIEVPSAPIDPSTGKHMTYGKIAEEIFGIPGVQTTPPVGEYFYIDFEDLYRTMNESIYNDIADIDTSIQNLVIKDYFPKEILENFNFEYVKSPNIGKVSEKVDYTDNSITWDIELLNSGEVATLSYKLTLKDDYNKEIVDKILPTNSKVDLEYTYENQKKQETATEFSKIRVRYVESDKDETITKKPLPQTGNHASMVVLVSAIVIAVFAISRVYYFRKLK